MVGSWESAGMMGGGGGTHLATSTHPSLSLFPLCSPLYYPPNPILQFLKYAGDRPWGLVMVVHIELWLRDEEEFMRLCWIDRVWSYGCCNSVQYWSLHSVFHSPLKIANIFICALWMTENTSENLNWAITVTKFCYAAILFQSCRNFLLYLDYTFYLSTLQTDFPTVWQHGVWQTQNLAGDCIKWTSLKLPFKDL